MTRKLVNLALVIVIAVLVGAAVLLITPDLPRETLIKKYAAAGSSFVTLPDGTVAHVEIRGPADKPAVVLLHGAMVSLQTWDSWMAPLSADYRVIAIDLPGHGLTGPTVAGDYSRLGMVSFVHTTLDRLGISRAAMIGHSMGGGVAAEYAERFPGETWALVLVDASGIPREGRETKMAKMARNPVTRALLPWVMPRWAIANGIRKTFGDPSKVADEMIDRIYDLVRFPGNRTGLIGHYLAKDDDATVEAGLSRLTVPTLVQWGEIDPVLPLAAGQTFQRLIPGARLIAYSGIGHDVVEENPGPSERDVAAFLANAASEATAGPPRP